MKSPYRIAQEIGVSPQAVYKRLTPEFIRQLNNHIKRNEKGKYLLDEEAEKAVKALFNAVEQLDQQTDEQPLLNQLNSENAFLRQRVEALEEELTTERTHSRAQSDKITELAAEMARLANNAQQLHMGDMIIPQLTDGRADPAEPDAQPGFFARIFKRRKG
jgi:chromosome segregation ATPase